MELTLLDLSEAKQDLLAKQPKASGAGSLSLQNYEQFADLFQGLKTSSGKNVNRVTALRAGAVLSCIRILSEDTATLPLLLKRRTKNGAVDVPEHSLYRLLKTSPNPFQTSVEMREHLVIDMILNGHFAAWPVRDRKGNTLEIYPLNSNQLTYQGQQDQFLYWNYTGPELNRKFRNDEIWRGNIMSQYIIFGRSIVLLAREAIGLALAAEEQGARLFSNGIQTDVAFKTPNSLGEDEKKSLRDTLEARHAGSGNSWRALLLENGLDVAKVGLTAVESQYIEARQYQLLDIARIFRIPGVLLGIEGRTSAYASAEQFFQSYVKHTLRPWIVRIEETIQRDLILPDEQDLFAKHDLSSLLRADQKTRFANYAIAINAGFMARNEARVSEDWDEVDGLDEMLTPLNMAKGGDPNAPQPQPGKNNDTGTDPTQPDPTNNETRLAAAIAETLLSYEVAFLDRQLAMNARGRSLTPAKVMEFWSWQGQKIVKLTGCTVEKAREYTSQREHSVNSLSQHALATAKAELVNLALRVSL